MTFDDLTWPWPWSWYGISSVFVFQLHFVLLTWWRVLTECDQSALRCLGSWPNIVEACNFDLWPDLDLTLLLRFVLLSAFVCRFSRLSTTVRSEVRLGGRPPPPPPANGRWPVTPANAGLIKWPVLLSSKKTIPFPCRARGYLDRNYERKSIRRRSDLLMPSRPTNLPKYWCKFAREL